MSAITTDERVRILLIEDNPADADLIREYIDADGMAENVDLSHVVRLGDALEQLRARRFDVILTDFNLPDAAGIPVLEELHKHVPDTPIVVITGTSQDLGLALEALRHGAQDYLIKGAATHSIHRSLRYAIERKQMEDALTRSETELRRQNALLQAMLDNMADGVAIADRDGRMLVFNPAAKRILGLGATNATPEQWSTTYGTFHADTSLPAASDELPLVRAIRGQASDDVELLIRRPELSRDVFIQTTGRPLRDGTGEVYGGMMVIHDITAHKEAEETLKHKNEELTNAYVELDRSRRQQLELKNQVLSHVSHELRTPLTAAYQFVTILKRGLAGDLQPQQKEYVEDIERNLKQLRTMIGDLLDSSRAESGKMTITVQCLVLQETVAEVVRMAHSAAAEKGVSLRAELPGDLPPVDADPPRVRQVLTNLLDNAQKFTPSGGSITIRARSFEPDPNFVCVSVTDTGRGIDPSEHQRIFSRLAQVDHPSEESRKGLGLGLFICREIVRRHGGDIGVESEPGAGSTFYFTLPKHVLHKATQQEQTHG
jgi:signal transduction histidine kinase/DNA-binding NarL/FixJ family response regulator